MHTHKQSHIDDLPAISNFFTEKMSGVQIWGEHHAEMMCSRHRFAKGVDFTPYLKGQPDDMCPIPHWVYCLKGSFHLRYTDGQQAVVKAGEVAYLPTGHTLWTEEDCEIIQWTPHAGYAVGEQSIAAAQCLHSHD